MYTNTSLYTEIIEMYYILQLDDVSYRTTHKFHFHSEIEL